MGKKLLNLGKYWFGWKYILVSVYKESVNPIQNWHFWAAHWWGAGAPPPPPPKICHTYPTLMKLCTVTRYLEKILKVYKSGVAPLEFCWH